MHKYSIRLFLDDETTDMVINDVTHIFLEANNTILTVCIPAERRHSHWPINRIRHYEIYDQEDNA